MRLSERAVGTMTLIVSFVYSAVIFFVVKIDLLTTFIVAFIPIFAISACFYLVLTNLKNDSKDRTNCEEYEDYVRFDS